jgi:hypothetical protein
MRALVKRHLRPVKILHEILKLSFDQCSHENNPVKILHEILKLSFDQCSHTPWHIRHGEQDREWFSSDWRYHTQFWKWTNLRGLFSWEHWSKDNLRISCNIFTGLFSWEHWSKDNLRISCNIFTGLFSWEQYYMKFSKCLLTSALMKITQ